MLRDTGQVGYEPQNPNAASFLLRTHVVLLRGFRAGRGAGALGRIFGVLFHELQARSLRDAAGAGRSCPRIAGTLREEGGEQTVRSSTPAITLES